MADDSGKGVLFGQPARAPHAQIPPLPVLDCVISVLCGRKYLHSLWWFEGPVPCMTPYQRHLHFKRSLEGREQGWPKWNTIHGGISDSQGHTSDRDHPVFQGQQWALYLTWPHVILWQHSEAGITSSISQMRQLRTERGRDVPKTIPVACLCPGLFPLYQ